MINLSYLDGVNDVEIYGALKSYFLLYSMIQSNSSTSLVSTIVNNLMEDYFYQNVKKLAIRS